MTSKPSACLQDGTLFLHCQKYMQQGVAAACANFEGAAEGIAAALMKAAGMDDMRPCL